MNDFEGYENVFKIKFVFGFIFLVFYVKDICIIFKVFGEYLVY